MPTTRIVVPAKAKKGDVIEVKALIGHVMETGFRHDNFGKLIPRDIITGFTCSYAGEEVFRMDLFTGVAANPFVGFTTIAIETGELLFEWTDQHGRVTRAQARIEVT
jgi:sulfur-oxidizing protein SoxZ